MDNLPEVVTSILPDLEEYTYTLRRKIALLKCRKDDVDEMLRHSRKKRKREVEEWLNNVENIKEEFETLEQKVQQSSRFYHVFRRQELAEQLERMTKEVTELVDQSDFPSGLFLEVDVHESNGRLLLTEPNGQAFLQNINDIWTSLMDDGILSIGIYGMGGVGKTTLAMRAHDRLLKESTFSGHVYWVTVSQEFSNYKLQTDIAQALKLDFSCGSDEKKRAAQLFQEFEKRGRFVLILDDVWKQIDASETGIPFKKDGCKLVVTSRSEEVCHSMCCKKIIKVSTLSYQEAEDLFFKTLDRDESSVEVNEICKKMVHRCDGLPLALITLAGSMRGVDDFREWRDAWEGLEVSCLGRANMEGVLPILLYSYDRLRDTRLRSCFLYCSLYPEDFCISRDEVIKDFISEELMEPRLSWQAEVDQGHAILNRLVKACLLEGVSDEDVKMHDLIREMAIGITKDTPRYMVKAGLQLKELPEEQEWTEDLDKVSLMDNSIEEISPGTSPKCPSLSTLILRKNPLWLIPDCFFTHMRGLRTLDLSKTEIESLPNSISDLEKLNALLLRYCSELESVPSLEKLKVLRRLDLTGTIIEEVPQGMESLTNLKSLYLSCSRLKMIPMGTLQRLTHLQQLVLPYHLDVPIEEVETLKQLEVFGCRLNSVRDLTRLLNSRQIDKPLHFYNITIGSRGMNIGTQHSLPCKHLHFGEDSLMESSLDTDENILLRNVENLFFSSSGLSGFLLDEFPILNSAGDLKECETEREDKIEYIMRLEEEQKSSGVPFQSLERLNLSGLPNLIGLFKWDAVARLPPGTFSCLKRLDIHHCGKIKKLFPQSAVHNFCNLQSLTIQDCVQMEEIIEQQQSSTGVLFQSLKHLELTDLPNLIVLFKWEAVVAPLPPGTFSCLKRLDIHHCGKIKKLFPQSAVHNLCNLQSLTIQDCVQMEEIIEQQQSSTGVLFQSLEHLKLTDLPNLIGLFKWEAVVAPLPPGTLSCLKRLDIHHCGKIKKLFPQSAVQNLRNLQILIVQDCVQMEEIIEQQQSSIGVLFESLELLYLSGLPNLIGLFKWEAVAAPLPPGTFSSLKYLSIEGCGKIKKLFPQSAVHNFRNLQSLIVMNCEQMEEIIEQQQSSTGVPFESLESLYLGGLPNLIGLFKWEAVAAPLLPGTFSCLKRLDIHYCGKIKKLFPQSAVHNFCNLQSLTIEDCVQMEEIIEQQQSSTGVPFQSLENLDLIDLPNLIGLFKWEAVAAPLPPGTFSCLKHLSIEGCGKIKKLFPQSAVHNFCNLQSLNVEDCVQMEKIIEDDNNEGADITLPEFQLLSLNNLPQVKSICKGKMICDSIEAIYLEGIKNIKELPLYLPLLDGQPSLPPRLERIVVDKEWWESLEWPQHNAKNVLEPLVYFNDSDAPESVEECN